MRSDKPIEIAISATALVNGLSEMVHRTLGETIAVETVLGAGFWRVKADPNELEAATLNLAVNARGAIDDDVCRLFRHLKESLAPVAFVGQAVSPTDGPNASSPEAQVPDPVP
ncbi:hypothetical protein [Bradyrhizobium commune]|uniref:hypothetical protein n=1 Tax=Bradyrhizobium commune TaxID=83627 RepID=UPI001FED6312|nr:hypothetical protein [Bradyrhizobium commune]